LNIFGALCNGTRNDAVHQAELPFSGGGWGEWEGGL
jgi:hypothetical protein